MTRSFYSSAIAFTVLYAVITLFKNVVYLLLGPQVGNLSSLSGWFTFELLVWWVWSVILLKYYYFKNYRFAFWTLILSILAALLHFFSFLNLMRTREVMDYYIITTFISLGTSILYGISLLSSDASEKTFLKAAGLLLLIQDTIMLSSIIWAINSTSFMQNGMLSKVEQWLSLAGVMGTIAFILHFFSEKKLNPKEAISEQESWTNSINSITMVVFVGAIYFGSNLISESIRLKNNTNPPAENLKKLAKPFETGIYVNSHRDTLRYRLMKPLNYDSTTKYPLVVCLHGSSGSGVDNVKQIASNLPASLLSKSENRAKYPAFLFVPQCPSGYCWGGIHNFPAIDSLVFEAIQALQKKLPLDADRYYVAGNSMGGYGTWHFISTRPEMFAAAIPISGGGDALLARNIVNVPVWAFHGAKDRNVPVSGSRDMIEAMKKAGVNPKYTEYPDKAHNIWNEVSDTPGLLDWLFVQKRKTK